MSGRSEQKIVDQTNELAGKLCQLLGYETPPKYKFYKSRNPRGQLAWRMACVAQEHLTNTEPDNALAELGLSQ
jgi:hypothetical protein